MKMLILGRGKTGSLVAEAARERGHDIRVVGAAENAGGAALSAAALKGVEVVIDFTTPHCVLDNIHRCVENRTPLVVGTTGWYGEVPRVREMVETSGASLLYAANFSIGVNLFFDIVRAAAPALRYGYEGRITETHHVHKKDAPSGTAVAIKNIVKHEASEDLKIDSVREGEIVGTHILELDSSADTITLAHEAKSRRGFAEGAVRAAEWLPGHKGFFDFKDVFRELV